MTVKTRHCDECEHFDCSWSAQVTKLVCRMKHKPKFYKVNLNSVHHPIDCGWKRRCEDFKESTREPERLP